MKTTFKLLAGLVLGAAAVTANAGSVPYPNTGYVAPSSTFFVQNTGDVKAYFFASSAAYNSVIGLKVNGVDTGIWGLPNHATAKGTILNFGSFAAGSELEFLLKVTATHILSSKAANNSDSLNHVYGTDFSGDDLVPEGVYVAFEDILPLKKSDKDYNDHQFVFTNVRVPEPAGLALLGLGLLALGATRRRAAK